MKYTTQDKEAGNIIDTFETRVEAEAAISSYETQDKNEGNYTPDFYEIIEN